MTLLRISLSVVTPILRGPHCPKSLGPSVFDSEVSLSAVCGADPLVGLVVEVGDVAAEPVGEGTGGPCCGLDGRSLVEVAGGVVIEFAAGGDDFAQAGQVDQPGGEGLPGGGQVGPGVAGGIQDSAGGDLAEAKDACSIGDG